MEDIKQKILRRGVKNIQKTKKIFMTQITIMV